MNGGLLEEVEEEQNLQKSWKKVDRVVARTYRSIQHPKSLLLARVASLTHQSTRIADLLPFLVNDIRHLPSTCNNLIDAAHVLHFSTEVNINPKWSQHLSLSQVSISPLILSTNSQNSREKRALEFSDIDRCFHKILSILSLNGRAWFPWFTWPSSLSIPTGFSTMERGQ